MKKKEWQISLILVCFILGLLLSIQFKTYKNPTSYSSYSVSPSEFTKIVSMLKDSEKNRELLQKEVFKLRKEIDEYKKIYTKNSEFIVATQQEMKKIKIATGLTKVSGPGISLILDDSKAHAHEGEDPNIYLVHEEDILKIVNELYAAGAETISVNGQRLIASSEIRCVGPTIVVNGVRISPPYEILAIGNPDTLDASLRMRGGIIEMLEVVGIEVKITKQKEIEILPYSGNINFKYTKEKE